MTIPVLLPVNLSWSEYCAGKFHGSSAIADAVAGNVRRFAASWIDGKPYSSPATPAMIAGSALDAIASGEREKVLVVDAATVSAKQKEANPGMYLVTRDTMDDIEAAHAVVQAALVDLAEEHGTPASQSSFCGVVDGVSVQTRPDFDFASGLMLDLKYCSAAVYDKFEREVKHGWGHASRYRIQAGLGRMSGAKQFGFLVVEQGSTTPRGKICVLSENELLKCTAETRRGILEIRRIIDLPAAERNAIMIERVVIGGDL